ncbi:hypothetical protein BDZ89DRAFT_1173163 [Hymenopellis radicata]|nr:hypothetical protein BDZ89DRAFT_1173163 [Hymenopellis radicata]
MLRNDGVCRPRRTGFFLGKKIPHRYMDGSASIPLGIWMLRFLGEMERRLHRRAMRHGRADFEKFASGHGIMLSYQRGVASPARLLGSGQLICPHFGVIVLGFSPELIQETRRPLRGLLDSPSRHLQALVWELGDVISWRRLFSSPEGLEFPESAEPPGPFWTCDDTIRPRPHSNTAETSRPIRAEHLTLQIRRGLVQFKVRLLQGKQRR